MNAYEFMQWLRSDDSDRQTGIDTPYSRSSQSQYGVMTVFDNKLIRELTREQKIEFSTKRVDGIYVLSIWTDTYICIPQCPSVWLLVSRFNQVNALASYCPDYVICGDYLVKIDGTDYTIYKQVDS